MSLDEAFELLGQGDALKQKAETGNDQEPWKILEQSANKYNEACCLMKYIVRRMSSNVTSGEAKRRQLIVGKINEYEQKAENLKAKVKYWKLDFQHQEQHKTQTKSNIGKMERISLNEQKNISNHSNDLKFSSSTSEHESIGPINRSQATNIIKEATQVCNNASLLLAAAIECDERGHVSDAMQHYMEAVKGYFPAVKVLSTKNGGGDDTAHKLEVSIKKKIKMILDRVEELRQLKERSCGAPMDNIHVTINDPIDSHVDEIHSSNSNSNNNHEQQNESLTSYEIAILRRSSTIASGIFLPWSDEEARTYNFFAPSTPLKTDKSVPWDDPDGLLQLSDKQQERFFKWARPSDIVAMRSSSSSANNNGITIIKSITPYTIKQHCVSDCSFVAGLCIAAAFERRFNRRLLSPLIYPQDPSTGMPIYNPRGVYMVKLWLNGVARRVMVDDLFPVGKRGEFLCSHTISFDGSDDKGSGVLELWVSILEKAYMKLCGGYNFPGSNSGVDLFSLTGWIPERIFFPEDPSMIKDFETPTDRAWERLLGANSFGDCLITVSTSKDLSDEDADNVGLFTAHAYAVLDVVQTSNGTKLLQLKNPWASKGWKGRFSSQDELSWNDPEFCAEVGYNANLASKHDDGVFWISWYDVLIYFRNLHLSWNPDLFPWKTTVHGFWDYMTGPVDDSFNVGENPQYIINLSKKAIENKATLWILLSRHVTKQEQEGGEVTDYLSLHIHRVNTSKQRVWYPGGNDCVLNNAYTNNQHVLIRYDVSGPEDKHLSIVLSQYQKSNDLGFSLKCYCTSKFKLGQPERRLQTCHILNGTWELRNDSEKSCSLKIGSAGGPPGKGSFGSNPQWSIMVPTGGTRLQFKCMAVKDLAVAVILVQSNRNISSQNQQLHGELPQKSTRVHLLYEKPIIDSGDYRHGFAVTEPVNVQAGLYTVVACTFAPGQVGKFLLHVLSSKEVFVSEIPF